MLSAASALSLQLGELKFLTFPSIYLHPTFFQGPHTPARYNNERIWNEESTIISFKQTRQIFPSTSYCILITFLEHWTYLISANLISNICPLETRNLASSFMCSTNSYYAPLQRKNYSKQHMLQYWIITVHTIAVQLRCTPYNEPKLLLRYYYP